MRIGDEDCFIYTRAVDDGEAILVCKFLLLIVCISVSYYTLSCFDYLRFFSRRHTNFDHNNLLHGNGYSRNARPN